MVGNKGAFREQIDMKDVMVKEMGECCNKKSILRTQNTRKVELFISGNLNAKRKQKTLKFLCFFSLSSNTILF